MDAFDAIKTPWAINELHITRKQQEELKAAEKEFYDNRRKTGLEVSNLLQKDDRRMGSSHMSPETRKKIDQLQPKPKHYIFAVLTPEQQQKFEKIAGQTFPPKACY